jgi:hypothetical protein
LRRQGREGHAAERGYGLRDHRKKRRLVMPGPGAQGPGNEKGRVRFKQEPVVRNPEERFPERHPPAFVTYPARHAKIEILGEAPGEHGGVAGEAVEDPGNFALEGLKAALKALRCVSFMKKQGEPRFFRQGELDLKDPLLHGPGGVISVEVEARFADRAGCRVGGEAA